MISLKAKRRLNKLADYLETINPDAFDMETWGSSDDDDNLVLDEEKETIMPEGACLTAGCAVGHACSIPAFRRLGLHMVYAWGFEPRFQGLVGFSAAAKFFDIDLNEADRLFDARSYDYDDRTDPSAVAARLRTFVKTGE